VDVDGRRLEHQQDAVPPRGTSNPSPFVSYLGSQELIERHSEGSSSIVCVSPRVPSAISSESYGIRVDMWRTGLPIQYVWQRDIRGEI
jgi:hypothetical protein